MKVETVETLIEKIERICFDNGVTVSEVLKKAGVSPQVFEDWKKFTTEPSFPTLMQMCKALGIELSALFCDGQPKYTPSQQNILDLWRELSEAEKCALYKYISAMKKS